MLTNSIECVTIRHNQEREKTMFDKDGNYYPNDDELNEFEESEELEEELKKLGAKPLRHPTDADTSALPKGEF